MKVEPSWMGLYLIKKKEARQLASFLSHQVRIQGEVSHLQPGRWLSPDPNHTSILISASRTVINKFLLFLSHLVYGTLLY